MSELTVTFGGQPIVVNLYDPLSADALTAIAGYAAAGAESATDAEAAAVIALAAAASADFKAARGRAHLDAWLSAAGEGARLLVTGDGVKTWRAGDPLTGDILTLAPLFGPVGAVLGQQGPYFDNSYSTPDAPLYPRDDPKGGIVHRPTTNLTLPAGVIAAMNGVWSLDRVFRIPPLAATFASVAAMNAAAGAHGVGDVVFVTGPTLAVSGFGTVTTDSILGVTLEGGTLTGGYYRRIWSGWESGFGEILRILDTAGIGTGQDLLLVQIDGVGKLSFYGYDGGQQAGGSTWYTDVVVAPGETHSLRIDCDGRALTLYFDGCERPADYRVLAFTPNAISLNGNYRAGASVPTYGASSGAAFTDLAVSITEGLDYTQSRAVSDMLAEAFGAPKVDWSPVAYVAIMDGQSEYSGPEGTTNDDGNRPDSVSGWNGLIARRYANDPRGKNPTQEFIPGVYAGVWRDGIDPSHIGALAAPADIYGIGAGAYNFSGFGETWDFGAARQFRQWSDAHLYFAGITVGAASLAGITAKGGRYLHSLKGGTAADLGIFNYRDIGNRQLLEIVDRCHARGQLVQAILIANVQGATDTTTVGTALAHEADVRQRWDDEVSQMVDLTGKPPLLLTRASNNRFSGGFDVATNTAGANYVDDEYRKLAANKDTGHPVRAITDTWLHEGTFIHKPTLFLRKSGEYIMDLACRYFFDGEFRDPLQPASVSIGTGGDAGKIVVVFNRPIETFTYTPTAPTTRQTGGFNTYGFVFAPVSGGRTISAAVTVAGSTAKIPISGGGPVAGDRIGFLGAGALWGNIREATARPGLYPDQDWGATIPLPDADPAFDEGALNDIREGAAAFTWVLA